MKNMKKKILAILLAAIMIIGVLPAVTVNSLQPEKCEACNREECACRHVGDVDGSGRIDLIDAIEILKYLSGMESVLNRGDKQDVALAASLIVSISRIEGKPHLVDVIEILKIVAPQISVRVPCEDCPCNYCKRTFQSVT